MKFPTSSSSFTVSSSPPNAQNSNAQISNLSVISSSLGTTSTSQMSSIPTTVIQAPNSGTNENKKGPENSSENVATSLTTTAGNFFRKYTNTGAGANMEMTQMSNKTVRFNYSVSG